MNKSIIIGTTASLVIPVGIYAPKGLALLFILAALGIFILNVVDKRSLLIFDRRQVILFATLPALGLLSTFWSSDQSETALLAIILFMTLLGGTLLIKEAWSRSISDEPRENRLLVLGLTIGLVLFLVEMVSEAGPYQFFRGLLDEDFRAQGAVLQMFNPGLSVTTLMLWPVLLLLVQANLRFLGAIVGLCVLAILHYSAASAPVLALACGGLAFTLTWVFHRNGPKIFVSLTIIAILALPWVPDKIPDPRTSENSIIKYYSTSDFHRVVIWKVAAKHIQNKFLLGEGLDSSRRLYDEEDISLYKAAHLASGKKWSFSSEPIPLHPHNAGLQIWLELGAVGIFVVASLIFLLSKSIGNCRLNRLQTAPIVAFSSNLMVISGLSFGIWQSWWLTGQLLASMTLAMVIARDRNAGTFVIS